MEKARVLAKFIRLRHSILKKEPLSFKCCRFSLNRRWSVSINLYNVCHWLYNLKGNLCELYYVHPKNLSPWICWLTGTPLALSTSIHPDKPTVSTVGCVANCVLSTIWNAALRLNNAKHFFTVVTNAAPILRIAYTSEHSKSKIFRQKLRRLSTFNSCQTQTKWGRQERTSERFLRNIEHSDNLTMHTKNTIYNK